MKIFKLGYTSILLLLSYGFNAQTMVLNEKLLFQLTKNQGVRMASETSFFKSYDKQKKLYDDVNKKVAQVVAIQEYIYQQLKNVNSAISQGKKMYYVYKDLEAITNNSKKLLSMTAQRPQYAILITDLYGVIVKESIKLKTELVGEILNKENDYIMDSYDRERIVSGIADRIHMIKIMINYIIRRLEIAKETPYLFQVPVIRNYLNTDKMIINDIMNYYRWLKTY